MNKNRSRNRKSLGDLISNIKYAAGGMVDPVEAWYRQKDQYKAVPSPQDVLAKESENFAQSVRSLENDPDIQKYEMAQGAMDMVAALGAEATNQISPKAGKWLSAGMQGWKALTAGDYMGYAQGGQIQNGEAMEGQQAFTPQDFEGMNQGFTMPDESMGSQGMGMEGQQEMGMDPQQARQFLMEHAQEIGLDPSQIEQMSDEEVVQLAQQVMQELQQSEGRESPDEMEGGEEIPEGGEEAMQPNMGTPYGSADEMNQLFAQGGKVNNPPKERPSAKGLKYGNRYYVKGGTEKEPTHIYYLEDGSRVSNNGRLEGRRPTAQEWEYMSLANLPYKEAIKAFNGDDDMLLYYQVMSKSLQDTHYNEDGDFIPSQRSYIPQNALRDLETYRNVLEASRERDRLMYKTNSHGQFILGKNGFPVPRNMTSDEMERTDQLRNFIQLNQEIFLTENKPLSQKESNRLIRETASFRKKTGRDPSFLELLNGISKETPVEWENNKMEMGYRMGIFDRFGRNNASAVSRGNKQFATYTAPHRIGGTNPVKVIYGNPDLDSADILYNLTGDSVGGQKNQYITNEETEEYIQNHPNGSDNKPNYIPKAYTDRLRNSLLRSQPIAINPDEFQEWNPEGNGMTNTPYYAQGGNVPVEVEGGEMYETPEGDVGQFQGPSHEEGGIPTELPQGTSIYSVRNGVGNNTMADRKKSRERRYNSALAAVQRNPTDPIARKTLSRILQVNQQQDAQDMAIQNTMHQIDELKAQLEQLLLNPKKKVASDEGGDEKQNGGTFATGGWLYNPINAEEEKKKEETKQARAEKIAPLANVPSNISWQELHNNPSYQNAVNRYKDSFMQKQQQNMMKDAQRENRLGSPSSLWDDVKGAFKKVKDAMGDKDYSTLIPTAGEALQQYARGRGIREKWRNLQMAQAATPINRNFYEDYGNRGIAEIDRGKQYIQDTLNQQLDELRYAKDAQQIRNRDSASGINQLRALDALNDLDYSRKVQQAKLQADTSMSQLNQAQANNYNNQDQIRMTGAMNADTANRRDTDNYFTQRDKMIDDTTRMIDQVGQYLNQKVADYRTNNAINSAAKYGQRVNQSGEMTGEDQPVENTGSMSSSQMASETKKNVPEIAQRMLYSIESSNPDWKKIPGITPSTMAQANNMQKTALGLATMRSAVAKAYVSKGWRMGNMNDEQVAKTYAYLKDVLGII